MPVWHASLAWLPLLRKKKKKNPLEKKKNDTYLQSSEVCRGGTDSQGVGVVSAQLDTYLKIHHIDEL